MLAVVAVIIVAALGTAAYLLLSKPATPKGPTLDHVTVSSAGGNTFYQGQSLILTAAAFDTNSAVQTQNATFSWSASPANAVTIASAGSSYSMRVTALRGGAVTIFANATWNSLTKSGSLVLTGNALSFYLSASNSHPLVPPVTGVSPFILTFRVLTSSNATYTNYQGTVHFTSDDTLATLPPDTIFSLADGGVKTFQNVTITKAGAVLITATDTVYSITGSLTVYGNRAPVASFTIAPNSVDPRIISVDGSGSTDPDSGQTATLTYTWAFGDGMGGSGATVAHTYAAAGTYSISLTVTDIYAASNTSIQTYTAHSPPTSVLSIKSEAPNGADILVWANGSRSTGGDGTIVYYNWTWGDGNQTQTTVSLAAHNYTSFWNGKTVTMVLRVANNYGLTNSTSLPVVVTSQKLPPVVTFTYAYVVGPVVNRVAYRTLYANATASSPTGTAILYYNWSWGDTSPTTNTTNPKTTHVYSGDGTYVVNVTVIDANMLKGYYQVTVTISVPASAPSAAFSVSPTKLFVSVDANASWDPNNNIAFYIWDWGDASGVTNTTNPWAAHTYSAAGRYPITLTVWDSTDLKGTATRDASVASSTLDYRFWDFFNVPYGEWWDMRNHAYGDLPINANCFNATSITDGICTASNPLLPRNESYPYTDWYPAPFGSLFYQQPSNDPIIYAPYRFKAIGSSVPGYNLSEPVFLPVMNYGAAQGSLLQFSWNMQYLDHATAVAQDSAGCPGGLAKFDDGFMIRSRVYLTMDAQETRRIFGLPSTATTAPGIRTWFAGQINTACNTAGPLESAFATALTNEGNGKYDIWNSYQFPYTPLYTNMSFTVDSDTTVHVYIDMSAWGTEALLARWFYWGNASYATNYLDSSKAKGWWGMELAWWEDFHFVGDLTTTSMDFSLNTVMQYHFQQGSNPGQDSTYHSSTNGDTDDVPYWTWGPYLSDYVASSKSHPYSELTRWNGKSYIHSTPGGSNYGQLGPYDYAPSSWAAHYGETWHFVFPALMRFYNPNTSPIPSNPQGSLQYWANAPSGVAYAYWKTNTANYGTYTNSTWVWDVAGGVAPGTFPAGWPTGALNNYPLQPYGSIFFVPWGSNPKIATASPAEAFAPSASSGSTSLASPGLGGIAVLSPLLVWTTTTVAAPAPSGPALSRVRA